MEKAEKQGAKVVKRTSAARGKQKEGDSVNHGGDREDVIALKKQIARP